MFPLHLNYKILAMNTSFILELIGYTGSFLVIISMLMTSVVKLRVINTIGSVIFCAYAVCIHSYPTAAMQLCLIAINAVSLYKLMNTKKEYSAIELKAEDGYLSYFLKTYSEDIKNFFPDFTGPQKEDKIYLINCGQIAAGLFIAKEEDDGLQVKLDYTTAAYRDTSAAKFFFNYLKDRGIKKLTARSSIPAHEKYLKKMGFSQSGDSFVRLFSE